MWTILFFKWHRKPYHEYNIFKIISAEAVVRSCFIKKVLLKILQCSRKNTSVTASCLIKLQPIRETHIRSFQISGFVCSFYMTKYHEYAIWSGRSFAFTTWYLRISYMNTFILFVRGMTLRKKQSELITIWYIWYTVLQ